MFESLIDGLGDRWTLIDDEDGATDTAQPDDSPPTRATPGEPIAQHESGAILHAMTFDDRIYCAASQPIQSDGYKVWVATDTRWFDDEPPAETFLRDLAQDIDDGDTHLEGMAVIPHDGTLDGITLPEDLGDGESLSGLYDVLAVRPSGLPDDVTVDDVRATRQPIIDLVYGERYDIPEMLTTISTADEPGEKTTIEVFTVDDQDVVKLDD